MIFPENASGRYDGAIPDDLIRRCSEHLHEADVAFERTAEGLTVLTPRARVALSCGRTGLAIAIGAEDPTALHQVREYLLFLLDHIAPGATQAMIWTGGILRHATPPNFHIATVRSSRRVAPRFMRVELDCPGARSLADGRGMHFSLLLPPQDRDPVWPRFDGDGRTRWPGGADGLHRAVYTFVTLDPAAGRFSFDVFEHEGGRVADWARSARKGETVGVMGPGSGDFPPGEELLMAGDETALPAIRRILEASPLGRRGDVFVEITHEDDVCDMPRPADMRLTWVLRCRGETLWDHLRERPAPQSGSRFVWIAAEQELVRNAKARFRGELGVRHHEGYFAYYWSASRD